MITVKAYLYPNTAEVQVFDPTIFTNRNRIMYSRPIKVYQGIDNPIQVVVKNQDQKSVDLTGYTVEASVQDPVNQLTINTYAVTFASNVALQKGEGSFVLDKATINSLEQRFYKLTFNTNKDSDDSQTPLYVDDNYGVPLDLEILPAYYSDQAPIPGANTYTVDGGTL